MDDTIQHRTTQPSIQLHLWLPFCGLPRKLEPRSKLVLKLLQPHTFSQHSSVPLRTLQHHEQFSSMIAQEWCHYLGAR